VNSAKAKRSSINLLTRFINVTSFDSASSLRDEPSSSAISVSLVTFSFEMGPSSDKMYRSPSASLNSNRSLAFFKQVQDNGKGLISNMVNVLTVNSSHNWCCTAGLHISGNLGRKNSCQLFPVEMEGCR